MLMGRSPPFGLMERNNPSGIQPLICLPRSPALQTLLSHILENPQQSGVVGKHPNMCWSPPIQSSCP
eukprot:3885076-Prorocentrum_lima.AAC.1